MLVTRAVHTAASNGRGPSAGGGVCCLGGSGALWNADHVPGEGRLVEELWEQQSVWSQTVNRMKTSIGRARSTALGLTIGSAVLATLAARLPVAQGVASAVLAVAAAVGVGFVLVLRSRHGGC
jgi:hypothetical protein